MEVIFEKAKVADYDEVMDLGNYVFSHAHRPTDFPSLLPKICRREYFTESIHYVARENGKIRAVIGAYPLELKFSPEISGDSLAGRGIGMVSVHPYCRTKGYMKELMKMAMNDMRQDGMVFSCLGGQRQRYEYFGFTQAGSSLKFTVDEANVKHVLGPGWSTGLSLRPVQADDEAVLDRIQELHNLKKARCERQREKLYDILVSYNAKILAVTENKKFCGYLIYKKSGDYKRDIIVTEINLTDPKLYPEVVGLLMRENMAGMESKRLAVHVCPHETEKTAAFSGFAEDYSQSPPFQFAVFDFCRFIAPFVKLKAGLRNLAKGSFIFQTEGGPKLELAVTKNGASVTEIRDVNSSHPGSGDPKELYLNSLQAIRFLFSPLAQETNPVIRENAFLQSLLPLPLFFENADMV